MGRQPASNPLSLLPARQHVDMIEELKGVVVFYLPQKRYGYLRVPGTREEFYFREDNLREAVQAGAMVRFVLKQGRYGFFADEIELIASS